MTDFGGRYWYKNSSQNEEVIYESKYDVFSEQGYRIGFDSLFEITRDEQKQRQILNCSKGQKSQYFKFGGVEVGTIGNRRSYESILLDRRDDDCFEKVQVNFRDIKKDDENSISIQVMGFGRKQFCTETYIFATASKFNVHSFILSSNYKFIWKNMTQVQYKNVLSWGIHIFRLCDTLVHWVPDVLKTIQNFFGGFGTDARIPFFGSKPPKYMQKLNVDFIEAATGFRWKGREPHFVNLSSYQVKSGDFIAATRFDGVDQLIQYGTGSHVGHSSVILEIDGIMSVVESQDGWYWPKHGIQRNDWQSWKQWALNADFNVVVLPLTEQSRQRFNVTAAVQFFKQKQGLPYGFHNFLFGWIDTQKENYPPLLDPNFIFALFSWLERIYEYPINKFLTQGLNKRLGLSGKKLSEIAVIMADKNMTFGDLMAIPEVDGWQYSDGESYVCSSFVAAIYKAGGLLVDIEATEMTPRDVYTLTIFDRNIDVPQKCQTNDPTLPYCQIMGSWLMELPGYATIEQYPHMAQKCPTMAPHFFRPENC